MAGTAPPDTMSPVDRRRLQNRIAQRRFRQKKALEQQCWLIDDVWHTDNDGYSIPTGPTTVSLELPMGSGGHSVTDMTPNPSIDTSLSLLGQESSQWERQSSSHAFGLTGIQGQQALMPISPPTSISSSSSEHGMGSSDHGNFSISQVDAILQEMFHPTNTTATGAAAEYSILTQSGLNEDSMNSVRDYLAAQWKHEKHPQPNWGPGKDQPPEPLIHTAVKHGNCDIVQMLINHGADVNERDSMGRTPIHVAIENQQAEVLMLLLETGIDVNLCDNEGRTALSMAVNNSCESGVRLFLMHGADPRCGAPVLA
ncbi:Ankyrin repeat domain-containing protein 2 [Cladobotryum mycophilum]|uniref:Ankyrin repeat domain-containing protein 2 n=1 Tax=Cladobotryum mycophilum TaxID=491253 RepID=A0ABR0SIL5_9HYPO